MITRVQRQEQIGQGFCSDDDIKQKEQKQQNIQKFQQHISHRLDIKNQLPPAQQIKEKVYSLKPDIQTGWSPKNQLPVPIPMIFNNKRVDFIVKQFLQKKNNNMKLCYLGPRFENTFYAWNGYQFQFPYTHIRSSHKIAFPNISFYGLDDNQIIFDAHLQAGNLDCAIKIGEVQYDLYVRVDSNTRGHLQWYNFKMKNLQKNVKYKINICNLEKGKTLYSRGQKPYIFSKRKFQKERKTWEQSGQEVTFQKNQKKDKNQKNQKNQKNERNEKSEKNQKNERNQKNQKNQKNFKRERFTYKLSFQYSTQYDNDQIQVAYCIPYTYSKMLNFIKTLQKRVSDKQYLSIDRLCLSLGGLQIPLITIDESISKLHRTSQNISQSVSLQLKSQKKCIIISGRVHPGESNASYMMEGFLQFLCANTKQAKLLRQNFVFKIIPMLNPDGVILGTYRTGISGKDFNRQYRNPDKIIFPEIYYFKELVLRYKKIFKQNLFMFIDFHGHSNKKNVFAYGPQFSIVHRFYYQCRVFPKLLSNHVDMFRYHSCTFKISQVKKSTARAIFFRKIIIPLSYTIQASNGFYYDRQLQKSVPFTEQLWFDMGNKIGEGLWRYGELLLIAQQHKRQKMKEMKKKKKNIKITKKSRTKQKISYTNHKNLTPIISQCTNERIKQILDDIIKEQKQPTKQDNDQKSQQIDTISEQSSDFEDEKDDLQPEKLKILFNIIKHKKIKINHKIIKKISNTTHVDNIIRPNTNKCIKNYRKSIDNQQRLKLIQQLQIDTLQLYFRINPLQFTIPLQEIQQNQKNQQFKKPNSLIKGQLFKNKPNHSSQLNSEKKGRKFTARVINFSFKAPHKTPTTCIQMKNKISRQVLNLSQIGLRKTCCNRNSPLKEIKSLSTGGTDRQKKNETFHNISARKILGDYKFQELKYNKLFIDGDNLKDNLKI